MQKWRNQENERKEKMNKVASVDVEYESERCIPSRNLGTTSQKGRGQRFWRNLCCQVACTLHGFTLHFRRQQCKE
jgi:hypothetical protein